MAVRSGQLLLAMVWLACSGRSPALDVKAKVLSIPKQMFIDKIEKSSAVFGTVGSVMSAALLADQVLLCSVSMLKGNGSVNQYDDAFTVSQGELLEFVKGINDVCDLSDAIVAHWDYGCGFVMEEVVAVDSYWPCWVSLECVSAHHDYTPIHGICYDRCENLEGESGATITECVEPLLSDIGLKHPRVCGDILAQDVHFNLMNPFEILFTYLTSVTFYIVDMAAKMALEKAMHSSESSDTQTRPTSTVSQFVGIVYHATVVIILFVYMLSVLNAEGVGPTCDFVIMNSVLFYGPYIFSSTQLLLKIAPEMTFCISLGEDDSDSFEISDCCLLISVPVKIVCFTIFAVSCFLITLASVAMIISAFWGFIGYIHITLTCLFSLGVVVSPFVALQAFLKYRVLGRDATGEDPKLDWDFLVEVPLFVVFALVSWTWLLLIHMGAFLLYTHGDYMLFHNSFYDNLFALPSWPHINIMPFSEVFWVVFLKIMSFDLRVLPSQVFEFTVVFQVAVTVCHFMETAICVAVRVLRRRSNSSSTPSEPDASASQSGLRSVAATQVGARGQSE